MEAPNGNGGGAPFPLSDAAPLCHDLPSDIADLDVSIVDPFVLGSLSLADTWKQVKEILTQEAPHVLPVNRYSSPGSGPITQVYTPWCWSGRGVLVATQGCREDGPHLQDQWQ